MLRFIVQRHEVDCGPCFERRDFFTLDIEVPQLEAMLRRGGKGEMGFDSWTLQGVEIMEVPDEPNL